MVVQLSKNERKKLRKQEALAKANEGNSVLALAQARAEETESEADAPVIEPEAETPNETPEPEETATEPVEEPAKVGDTDTPAEEAPAMSLADLVRNAEGITEEARAKLLEEAQKIDASETRSANSKAMVEFNKELETELPKFLDALVEKHKVDMSGRRIRVDFPKEGDDKTPKLTSSAKGNGAGSTREGFPSRWGKATIVKDGKSTTHDSPGKAAESLGLQVQGHRDMIDVFENPTKAGSKEKLPKIYTVSAVKGDHFTITIGKAKS